MLQLFNIFKEYKTGPLVQKALNDVTLSFRDCEFVSVLGPSGSGKTTLLNIIGGLDQYDSGDLVIDGVSTKKYSSKNWDAYRNHSIGFVFQSYNLIPHQSILANVELALTIGGLKGKERRERAEAALKEVGLEEHMHKRPNQLSGGQMQRVAIARALVNDPKIVLADEPTGALDSETGIQVMELLKKVAENKLVVMVTHNNELAEKYSTRIVCLKDGQVTSDSKPLTPEEISGNTDSPAAESNSQKNEDTKKKPETKKTNNKSKMGFATSLALSFNNLRTKTARTVITSVAGSIGIIGIALILALSQGVTDYTVALQRDAMESFPIKIDSVSYDYSDIVWDDDSYTTTDPVSIEGKVTASVEEAETMNDNSYMPTEKKNNLESLKDFFEDPKNNMDEYVGTGSVVYGYYPSFFAYAKDPDGKLVNTSSYVNAEEIAEAYSTDLTELPRGRDDSTISKKTQGEYTVVYGNWPENEDELVLITNPNGSFDASTLVKLGYITHDEYKELVSNPDLALSGKKAVFSYEQLCDKKFTILPSAHRFIKDDTGYYTFIEDSDERITDIIKKHGKEMKVTGIICPNSTDNSGNILFSSYSDVYPLGYSYKTTNYLIEDSQKSDAIKEQLENDGASIITGFPFNQDTKTTATEIRKYLHTLPDEDLEFYANIIPGAYGSSGVGTGETKSEFNREMVDAAIDSYDDQKLIDVFTMYNSHLAGNNLEDCLQMLGYASFDKPYSITIYPDTFEGKQEILKLLEKYNAQAHEKDRITYYDYIKEITDGISQMVFAISMVLIAFVSISLIVSCIMIGIITHISVLERTKEIGILRALGASKGNISQVFNAETFIIGLLSGTIGIGVAMVLCIPMNLIISSFIEQGQLNAMVPPLPAIGLIALSTIITMIGGLIPAMAASRKDPVIALRTE